MLGALLSSHMIMAEEMKFTYTLPDRQSICFFQNLAENIQGKTSILSTTRARDILIFPYNHA